jgi:hypothetical protein
MKFAIFTTLLAICSGLVASVPVPDAEVSNLKTRSIATIYPDLVVEIYSPNYGYTSNSVYVSRYTYQGQQYDTNALLEYTFSQGYPGKTCTFAFSDGWYAGGTQKVQLFSVGGPISTSNTFTSRPYRDISYGIFTISVDGTTGTWDDIPIPTFPCPATATSLGFEVVPEGDSDYAGWDINAGLAIVVL